METITSTHPDYLANENNWEFYLRSYLGGDDYRGGNYLVKYLNESKEDYSRRVDLTPIDNHCANVVHIYSSFLWKQKPVRNYNSMDGDPILENMVKDVDLDGQSLDSFMKEVQIWSSVYGHCWVVVDKPKSNAGTKAEELEQNLRPYFNLYTPENVFDWKWERTESGRHKLTYLKIRESVIRINETDSKSYFREWTEESVKLWEVHNENERVVEEMENPIGVIPATYVPAARSVVRGIGKSDIADISIMQKAIYNELSEIEQLIRISNHPTLVKSFDTDATAGAGGVVNMPDELDGNLKPYMLQPSGANLDAVMASIGKKTESINRMAHLGAVRGTEAVKASGIALQTEFQLLNARLAEKADLLELAEEQLWRFVAIWQDKMPDVEVYYPDSFDIRDYGSELDFLQKARASGVKSLTYLKAVDKQIADLILDDQELQQSYDEIEEGTRNVGDFSERTQIYKYHIDSGVVSANEVRQKIGLEDVDGGDELIQPVRETTPQG
jgi:hypothetical protein